MTESIQYRAWEIDDDVGAVLDVRVDAEARADLPVDELLAIGGIVLAAAGVHGLAERDVLREDERAGDHERRVADDEEERGESPPPHPAHVGEAARLDAVAHEAGGAVEGPARALGVLRIEPVEVERLARREGLADAGVVGGLGPRARRVGRQGRHGRGEVERVEVHAGVAGAGRRVEGERHGLAEEDRGGDSLGRAPPGPRAAVSGGGKLLRSGCAGRARRRGWCSRRGPA